MLNILIDIIIEFFFLHLLLEGLHKNSLSICELFCEVKMKNGFVGKYKKTETQKEHSFFTATVNKYENYPTKNKSNSKLYTRLFRNKNNSKIGWENMRAHFLMPLNYSARRKVGILRWILSYLVKLEFFCKISVVAYVRVCA